MGYRGKFFVGGTVGTEDIIFRANNAITTVKS